MDSEQKSWKYVAKAERELRLDVENQFDAFIKGLGPLRDELDALKLKYDEMHDQRFKEAREADSIKAQLDAAINAYDTCAIERDNLRSEVAELRAGNEHDAVRLDALERMDESIDLEKIQRQLDRAKMFAQRFAEMDLFIVKETSFEEEWQSTVLKDPV